MASNTYYLHHNVGLGHCDLKPDNFIFTDDWSTSLIDLAHAYDLKQPMTWVTGTDIYMAPEVRDVMNGKRSFYTADKVDSFNLGVCFFIVMFMKPPFKSATYNDPFYKYLYGNTQWHFDKFFMAHRAQGCNLGALQLIWCCLNPDPSKRPSIDQVMMHPWIAHAPPSSHASAAIQQILI
jgi:serine/threonine protein kinase